MYSTKCRKQRNLPAKQARLKRAFHEADARGDDEEADLIVDELRMLRDIRRARLNYRAENGDTRARRLRR